MKKIKNKYHLLVSSLITTLLGFFGVSCGGQELLYGSPHAEYNVKGEVTNEDGEALESMQVSLASVSPPPPFPMWPPPHPSCT